MSVTVENRWVVVVCAECGMRVRHAAGCSSTRTRRVEVMPVAEHEELRAAVEATLAAAGDVDAWDWLAPLRDVMPDPAPQKTGLPWQATPEPQEA